MSSTLPNRDDAAAAVRELASFVVTISACTIQKVFRGRKVRQQLMKDRVARLPSRMMSAATPGKKEENVVVEEVVVVEDKAADAAASTSSKRTGQSRLPPPALRIVDPRKSVSFSSPRSGGATPTPRGGAPGNGASSSSSVGWAIPAPSTSSAQETGSRSGESRMSRSSRSNSLKGASKSPKRKLLETPTGDTPPGVTYGRAAPPIPIPKPKSQHMNKGWYRHGSSEPVSMSAAKQRSTFFGGVSMSFPGGSRPTWGVLLTL